MSASHAYQNTKAEEYARWRRRDHANIEAMQNLIIARIAEETGVEMPPNVRHLISALQGVHGGGSVAYEPFSRDYLTIGAQLQFTGTDEAIRQRVRRWVDDLLNWQATTGFELFDVVKGGEIIGNHADGTPKRKPTTIIDNLKPKADEAAQRARASDLWRGNEQKGLKAHPGKALAAEVERLKKELPRTRPLKEDERPSKSTTPLPAGEYARQQRAAVVRLLEKTADGIEERDADADLWLEEIERDIRKIRDSRRKTAPARRSWIMPDEAATDGDTDEDADADGNTYMGITPEVPTGSADAPETPALRIKNDTQATPKMAGNSRILETESDENTEPDMLAWALWWAASGVPVFPLHEVYDDVCTCTCTRKRCKNEKHGCGSECGNKGKHPRNPNGVTGATTDEATIRAWWTRWPSANIGGAMGGASRLVALDSDPRHGGDASLFDLAEVHGSEWLNTARQKTGGGGDHFFYITSVGVELRNTTGKIGPGLDTRATGGYVVLAPSLHASGARYELAGEFDPQPVPVHLLEAWTREETAPPAKVVDFQERREAKAGAGPRYFADGERNNGLRDLACGRWLHGYATDDADLYQQMLRVRAERCAPGDDGGATDAELWDLCQRTTRKYQRGELKAEGGAA